MSNNFAKAVSRTIAGVTITPTAAEDAGISGGGDLVMDNPLAAEPTNATGALIGYARVSTAGPLLDRQLAATPP